MINWLIIKFLTPRLRKFLAQYPVEEWEEERIEQGFRLAVIVYRRGKKPTVSAVPTPPPPRSDPMHRSGPSGTFGKGN